MFKSVIFQDLATCKIKKKSGAGFSAPAPLSFNTIMLNRKQENFQKYRVFYVYSSFVKALFRVFYFFAKFRAL